MHWKNIKRTKIETRAISKNKNVTFFQSVIPKSELGEGIRNSPGENERFSVTQNKKSKTVSSQPKVLFIGLFTAPLFSRSDSLKKKIGEMQS